MVPYWVQDAVFYQIFPDRFANGVPENDPPNVQRWGTKPSIWGFQGGDLRGVINNFDYLLELGVNALYFNPIFRATSNHRYNISDYFHIDRKLGDMDDFRALLDIAHKNHVRVILDGVFNHCGRGFFAFNDVLENHQHSPYLDWFHLNHVPPDAYSPGDAADYDGWWKHKSLPEFNISNPKVRSFLLEVARFWIEQGADGWRLDVPNEIDDDSFWAAFRETVKSTNKDAYLMGEIWDGNPRWVGDNHFDGLMNYPLREGLLQYLSEEISSREFAEIVDDLLNRYAEENVYAMYLPLGSHDTRRIATALDEDMAKVKMAFLFQFAFPGAPAIYYGDEIGMRGGKDPDCRGAFPWNENDWDLELRELVKSLIDIRKRNPVLRRGSYQVLGVDPKRGTYTFGRKLGKSGFVAAFNASSSRRHLKVNVADVGWRDGRIVKEELTDIEYVVSGDTLNLALEPWSGEWIF